MKTRRSTPLIFAFLSLCVLFLWCPEHQTAIPQTMPNSDVRGRITITRAPEPEGLSRAVIDRYNLHLHRDSATATIAPKLPEFRLSERAVVYLESDLLNHGKHSPPEKHPVLDQRNLQFHPQVLPILVGTTVDFPNRDNLYHNVFSYSQAKEFDLGRYPKDDSRSVQFNKPGLVRVYCDIHAHMNATIIVLQHPYFATPNDDGTYVIHQVPEGRYSIILWIDRDRVERRSIEVRAGETTIMDFTF